MKALTLKAPWAYAVAHLGKDVENRGERLAKQFSPGRVIAIHAGARATWTDKTIGDVDAISPQRYWISTVLSIHSRIVAVATVDRVDPPFGGVSMSSPWRFRPEYGIILRDVIPLDDMPTMRGQLGLWTVPEDVEQEIMRRLTDAP